MINTKENFIKNIKHLLKKCLKDKKDSEGNTIDDINIGDIVSVVDQNIGNYEYVEFMQHIHSTHYELQYKHIGIYDVEGEVIVSVFDVLHNKIITYYIGISFEFENGTCENEPLNIDWNKDWYRPVMTISKEMTIGQSSFIGSKQALLEYKAKLNLIDIEKEYKKERIISIENELEILQQEYACLKNELNELDEEDFD